MFVNASAFVAILTRESDTDELANALDSARSPITSPVAVLEATCASVASGTPVWPRPQEDVLEFLETARVDTVSITEGGGCPLDAFFRYGKDRGHPAQLNLGDCFAYAVAKTHRTALLFKGEDFRQTDIRLAAIPRRP